MLWHDPDFDVHICELSEHDDGITGMFPAAVLATALAFGQDQLDFVDDYTNDTIEDEDCFTDKKTEKISLRRHLNNGKKKGKPFERWYLDVLYGKKEITDKLELNEEELFIELDHDLKFFIENF